jgi:hypothetical protein
MMTGFTVDTSMRVMSCPFAMIPMTRSTLDGCRFMGRSGDIFMASDAGNPPMDRLPIFLLIDIERHRFPIHLLFHIFLSMTIHAEKNRDGYSFVTVQVGLTMALPTELLLRLHDLFVGQPPSKRERGNQSCNKNNKKENKEVFSHPSFLFLLRVFV